MLSLHIRFLRHTPYIIHNCAHKSSPIVTNTCRPLSSPPPPTPSPRDSSKVQQIKSHILNKKSIANPNNTVIDANVLTADHQKPVLLYANERCGHYRLMCALNACQLVFWIFFANFGISLIIRKPKTMTTDEMRRQLEADGQSLVGKARLLWRDNSTQVLLSLTALTVGQLSMALLCFYAIRSVRYVILAPGGQSVRFTTFSVTGSPNRYRHYDAPVEHVSTQQHRSAGGILPVKLKGKWMYFLVDTKTGHFYKPALFDRTVGVFRILK